MKNIEIPPVAERGRRYRFFEILPGAISWTMLAMPFILSFINVTLAAFFILLYLLIYFARAVGVSTRALQGHRIVTQSMKLPWDVLLVELQNQDAPDRADQKRPAWHYQNIQRIRRDGMFVSPNDLLHVVFIATVKESRAVLEPTIQSVLNSTYDMKQVILVMAYEQRGGAAQKKLVDDLLKQYGSKFRHAMAVGHPADIPGELIGKGGNITYAARQVEKYLKRKNINPNNVVVTTLDSDNRPHHNFFAALSYVYCAAPDPIHVSFQPVSMYTNNIWDAPAPMRVIATGNTYWNTVLALRPHLLRNFSAHSQSMRALIDTDYWSVRTIVEDGHQFWRTYMRYDGNHFVYPIYVPIYQDAVLAETYIKTLRAQFVQLRRWTWGVSDVAYVAEKGFFTKNNIPRVDLWFKFGRLLEGHINWAVGPIILAFAAFIPVMFNPDNYAANELPIVVSQIQRIALLGALASIYICFKTLPPKPARYKHHRTLFMLLQWVYMPVTSLLYSSAAALNSQTRLMFGKYLDKFDVTVKAVVSDDGKTVSSE
jgi:cellulose synthase/poly-beta-1,6-N-acetylglucosamine synthase-like glycosyltransferase